VFEHLSFNFGPTLLDWMERDAPAVYRQVLAADRASVRSVGHGNALAMPYHHVILPLLGRRDKETEVRWGIADFVRRFGRRPDGMWLPETAVDLETLDVLAAQGIGFTLLAPHQVTRPPANGMPGWVRVRSGRQIAVLVYDGARSHDVAFGGALREVDRWGRELASTPAGAISIIAVDGETFGHHHTGGDRALATVLQRLSDGPGARIRNLAHALAAHPALEDLELVAPSSWSCTHGIERWRADCGCRVDPSGTASQQWRAPLRAAVDWLGHEIHALYQQQGAALPGGPWVFRDAAGGAGPVPGADPAATRLVEMERGALRAQTSCGWFFDEVDGLEVRRVLRYAAYTIGLTGPEAPRLEAGFSERLGPAADVYAQVRAGAVAA
jgi:hypothetical protein